MTKRNGQRLNGKRGFTLVELLIVVVILGILGAIVIPSYVGATDDAKLDALKSHLTTIRAQIELYRMHHNSQYPDSAANFSALMTQYSDLNHGVSATQTPTHVYGPYLLEIPDNPFTGTNDVTSTGAGPAKAWYYNPATGEFRTNDGVHDSL